MADIKMSGYNENTSTNDGSQWAIHFVLPEAPDAAWKAEFDSIRSKNKNQQVVITSTAVNGKELVAVASARLTAQQIHEKITRIVELTNQAQSGLRKQTARFEV
jgi:hypothetical protein